MSDEKLDKIAADVADIKSMLKSGAATSTRPAWMNPPITAEQAVIDGKTINTDGSVWVWDTTGRYGGDPGQKFPVCSSYGYFSAEKNPETHEGLSKLFGQHYLDWYEARDPWAIYKADISDMVRSGTINWINFSWLMQPYSRFVQ